MTGKGILEVLCFSGPLALTVLLLLLGLPHWSLLAALAMCPAIHVVLWLRASREWQKAIRGLDLRIKNSERGVT